MTSSPNRTATLEAFLTQTGWAAADRDPLPGDASLRRYIRLSGEDGRAMLMDAPPETGEDIRPFVRIAAWLTEQGFGAPQILAQDAEQGFLLLEDLGDDLIARYVAADPEAEPLLYATAAEMLAELHRKAPPVLPHYPDQMADLAATIVDWYAPDAQQHKAPIRDAMQSALDRHLPDAPVLVHRDFHAENLLWLPERTGLRRIGLLDFQDAMTGPAEYDLASLIHDPRRPVSPSAARAAVDAYLTATGADADGLATRIAVCSVQRSMRIIGRVFTRLCLHSGRTSYLRFIPPTWAHLQRELDHPALRELRDILAPLLPVPDADWIADKVARSGSLRGRDHAGAQ